MTRRALAGRLAPAILVLLLAGAWLAPSPGWLRLGAAESPAADRLVATLDALPPRPIVLIGFDPDIGTYAEVRPTVRALLAELLRREARLAMVSVTPEGRALALAELARLERLDANPRRILDLGFVPGAEAALVRLTRGPLPVAVTGALSRTVAEGGMEAVDAVLAIGGNDVGPRSWVEQVLPRVDDVRLIAVAPTVLLPELLPYVETEQIDALLGTPSDGAAFRAGLDLERLDRFTERRGPSPPGILVGSLVAIALLGEALGRRVLGAMRGTRRAEAG